MKLKKLFLSLRNNFAIYRLKSYKGDIGRIPLYIIYFLFLCVTKEIFFAMFLKKGANHQRRDFVR